MISIVIISKDEPSLDETLSEVAAQINSLSEEGEIIVVDASCGRLDHIRDRHKATVRWVEFMPLPGIRISIPHQRNVGVRAASGDIIVFIDAGCSPLDHWLERLVAPLRQTEMAVAGPSHDAEGDDGLYQFTAEAADKLTYLSECPTLNFAFRRSAFDAVGGFDEIFSYGSDVDFTWRLNDAGYRIRLIADALIQHDYGTPRRQRRRSYVYGKARLRLYRKHRERRGGILKNDPMMVIYPLFLLGLPITFIFPAYPLLLLIPAWRSRSRNVIQVLIDHLWYGAGVLAELVGG